MIHVRIEITKEEYDKAMAKNAYAIISDAIVMGYGCYGAKVSEKDGHYYLEYSRGDSCD